MLNTLKQNAETAPSQKSYLLDSYLRNVSATFGANFVFADVSKKTSGQFQRTGNPTDFQLKLEAMRILGLISSQTFILKQKTDGALLRMIQNY